MRNNNLYEKWLNQGFQPSTKRLYKLGMRTFLQFLNETEPKNPGGYEWTVDVLAEKRLEDLDKRDFWFEEKVLEYFEWLKHRCGHKNNGSEKEGFISDNSRVGFVSAVRSFFAFRRCDFRFTLQQSRLLGRTAQLVEHDYLFSLNDMEEMDKVANPQERYILFVGKDVGLRAIDFAGLTQGHFLRALKTRESEEPPIFLGKVYTQKEGVYAYPFLTEDGINAGSVWLRVLQSKGRLNDDAPMLDINKKELSENVKRLATKAGIETHGERVRFHNLRKFLIDRLSIGVSESKWKQIVGKQISEGAYVSPFELKACYASALERIMLPRAKAVEDQEKIKELEGRVNMLYDKLDEMYRFVRDGKE